MWQIQLNAELKRQPDDTVLLKIAAYNFVRSIITLLAWEEARIKGGSRAPIEAKDLTLEAATRLLDKGDVNGLLELVKIATRTKALYQSQLDKEYRQQMEESQQTSELWNTRFMWCYIVGSLLLGLRWFMTAILGWPDKRSNVTSGSG